jgi:flagellum-specific peptidoglycan hydrolase FlgJ
MRVNYSQKLQILVVLSAVALLIYKFLNVKTISNNTNLNGQAIAGNVYTLLQQTGLNEVLSRYATAQAAHETNCFTSAIFNSNHNCFGMKYAKQVNAVGEKNGYADYIVINNSIADFVQWYTRHRVNIFSFPLIITSLGDYVSFLKNNDYFEADEADYLSGCQYFYNQIFST